MSFQLTDLLKAIGPNASIIFAAWIFLSFLQARYDSAIERYRGLIETYRRDEQPAERRDAINRDIRIYARRCTLMSRAVTLGLVSATLLIFSLINAALDVIFPKMSVWTLVSTGAAIAGFSVVLGAAVMVIVENSGTPDQLRGELDDLDIGGGSATRSTKLTS